MTHPLAEFTLEELREEIKRRCDGGVIVVRGYDPKDREKFASEFWGSTLAVIGACEYVAERALRHLESTEDEDE